jgi:hypothetical protein
LDGRKEEDGRGISLKGEEKNKREIKYKRCTVIL